MQPDGEDGLRHRVTTVRGGGHRRDQIEDGSGGKSLSVKGSGEVELRRGGVPAAATASTYQLPPVGKFIPRVRVVWRYCRAEHPGDRVNRAGCDLGSSGRDGEVVGGRRRCRSWRAAAGRTHNMTIGETQVDCVVVDDAVGDLGQLIEAQSSSRHRELDARSLDPGQLNLAERATGRIGRSRRAAWLWEPTRRGGSAGDDRDDLSRVSPDGGGSDDGVAERANRLKRSVERR